jgi:glycosyltransferase involved in cell wall biosynthesis
MRIAYLTAGAAGMYCGSCMHDNALAKALANQGCDCLLLPVYTPIRTDEESVSSDQIFFGGINVFLQQKLPILGRLPRFMTGWLDSPWLLRLATRKAGGTRAETLGDLTVSMLQGKVGHQAAEVERLVRWLTDEFKPDCVLLSNLLIGGCIPEIRKSLPNCKIYAWLQGDDIFLDFLPTAYRAQATTLLGDLARQTDACLVNSRFYAESMGLRLGVSPDHFRQLPLSINTTDFLPLGRQRVQAPGRPAPIRIGYFARLAPEKGFHNLVDAFIDLAGRYSGQSSSERTAASGLPLELHYAGWLGEQHRDYFAAQQLKLDQAGLREQHVHHGSPDREGKLAFLRDVDMLCVPTDYADPKGLFLLEAMAAAVPVVQPNHGAFPELIKVTGGGLLYQAGQKESLLTALSSLIEDESLRRSLGQRGYESVRANHSIEQQASQLLTLLKTQ